MVACSRVSVIIPVYNAAGTLAKCLQAVCDSPYRPLEVIVVDDASNDHSAEIAKAFPCRVIRSKHHIGPAQARNRGSDYSHGDILLFIDADVLVLPQTIEQAGGILEKRSDLVGVIGSYTKDTPARNFVSRYKNYLHHYTHQRAAGEVASFFTACGAIRKRAFKQAGGFDKSITTTALEDVELGYRLWRYGHKVLLDGTLQVKHLKRYTLGSLLRSDLFGRAIPYAHWMIKHRIFKAELSTSKHNIISVFLVFLLLLLAAWTLISMSFLVGALLALLIALALAVLNSDFYLFLWRETGVLFTLRAVAMQWWGYFYSGLGLAIGLGTYSLSHISAALKGGEVSRTIRHGPSRK